MAMNNRTIPWKKFLILCATLLFVAPSYAASKGTISGQVVDTDGIPIAGVSVSVEGGPSGITDPGGLYVLTDVKHQTRIVVTFEKDGYVLTQGAANLGPKKIKKPKKPKKRDSDSDSDSDSGEKGDSDSDSDSGGKGKAKGKKRFEATLNRTMLENGAVQILNSETGGEIMEGGFKVTFDPDTLTVTGDVEVVISPLDVSGNQIAAAPGDFTANTLSGEAVLLESFSMVDITLMQNGLPVNLGPGATAEIELLLPETTSLVVGDTTPMWFFDVTTGRWQEEGVGTVGDSTVIPGRLAIFATVSHFTWWNSDQRINTTTVTGTVIDGNGNPVAGASVAGTGVDYAGRSYAVPTDVNGNYCLNVRSSSTTELIASITAGGLSFTSVPLLVASGPTQANCADDGGVQTVPDIVLINTLSCVEGDVLDESDQPVVGATVFSTVGSYTATDANGMFSLLAPENTSVTVLTTGFPAVTVTTPASDSGCASAPIRPGTSGGGLACITGLVFQCGVNNPYPGITVEAFGAPDTPPLGVSNTTGADGVYCIDGLPENTAVQLIPIPENSQSFGDIIGSTGPGGGTCATNTCNPGPGVDVYCF